MRCNCLKSLYTVINALLVVTISKTCNVIDYGAKGDGKTNDSNAILSAINDCNTNSDQSSPSQLLFPSNYQFKTWPFIIDGNDISSQKGFNIKGSSIKIEKNTSIFNGVNTTDSWPSDTKYQSLIHITNLKNGFSFIGSNDGYPNKGPNPQFDSIIDGKGQPWWVLRKATPSAFAPRLIVITECNNIIISGLTLQNSPMFHLPTSGNTNLVITNMTIVAPSYSPNTDAIDVVGNNVNIQYNYLATGDDNVAIGNGAQNVIIQDNWCGHGHGTSIGSIGENNSTGYVSNILFQNNVYNTTDNVARIKTWQGGHGDIHNITYRNIEFMNVQYPIRINQYYCPSSQHPGQCKNFTAAVHIHDITFENFYGTQHEGYAGTIWCSDSVHCDHITMKNVTVKPYKENVDNQWSCWEVDQSISDDVNPSIEDTSVNCQFSA